LSDSHIDAPQASCRECRSPVPLGARICPTCHSYLDWRRFVNMGQANLALLVALISVVTTLLTIGLPLYHSRGADIGLVVASTEPDKIIFIVHNDGRSGGMLRITDVGVTLLHHQVQRGGDFGDPGVHSYLVHDSQFIEPGKEQRLSATLKNKTLPKDICALFKNLSVFDRYATHEFDTKINEAFSDIECNISTTEANFYTPETSRERRISCQSIGWVQSCIYSYFEP